MGGVSRRIISNNYDSVVAAQEMKESLERQDSAALFALLGAREKASAQLREHRARFDASLKKAESNITEAGEREAIEAIRRDRDSYYQMFDAFVSKVNATESSRLEHEARDEELAERNEYFTRLEPQFNKLRADCEHLLQLNQRAMLAKSEAAAGVAQLWFYRTSDGGRPGRRRIVPGFLSGESNSRAVASADGNHSKNCRGRPQCKSNSEFAG